MRDRPRLGGDGGGRGERPVPAAGGPETGTTAGRSNTVSALCNGSVMNGADAVYRIHFAAPGNLTLTLTAGSFPVTAYAVAPCTLAPATPACVGNAFAVVGNPAVLGIATAGDYFIVVDGANAGLTGTYALSVTAN